MARMDVINDINVGWCQFPTGHGVKPHASSGYVVVCWWSLTHVLAMWAGSILVWTLILPGTLRYVTCVTSFIAHN